MNILTILSQVTPMEWAANFFTVVCIVLAGRNNIHTWWTGIVACILFAIVFLTGKLYADVTLQVFFIATSIIGWKNWAPKTTSDNIELPQSASTGWIFKAIGVALIGAIVYGAILHAFTDAYAPFIDSLVLMGSIVAQLLLMRRQVETWPVWVFVNTLSVPLYFSRELYVTGALYVVFFFNALYSWYHWRKLMGK